jgi:hypothetical protein
MKTILYLLVAFSVLITLAGCNLQKTVPETAGAEETSASREDGLRSLACFKCHDYEAFSGGFPHELHIGMMGIHCTKCHTMKAHKEITLNKRLCANCHANK